MTLRPLWWISGCGARCCARSQRAARHTCMHFRVYLRCSVSRLVPWYDGHERFKLRTGRLIQKRYYNAGIKRGYASFGEGSPMPQASGRNSMAGLRRACCTDGDLGRALRPVDGARAERRPPPRLPSLPSRVPVRIRYETRWYAGTLTVGPLCGGPVLLAAGGATVVPHHGWRQAEA